MVSNFIKYQSFLLASIPLLLITGPFLSDLALSLLVICTTFYIIKEKQFQYSKELLKFAEKRVMLFQIDKDWRDHLAAMDSLRGSVNLRAMGGKDPFYEYKKESFDYFDEMLSNQNERVLKTLFNIKLVNENNNNDKNRKQTQEPRRIITKKIGRNEPCPCGSGKKYKQCHGS